MLHTKQTASSFRSAIFAGRTVPGTEFTVMACRARWRVSRLGAQNLAEPQNALAGFSARLCGIQRKGPPVRRPRGGEGFARLTAAAGADAAAIPARFRNRAEPGGATVPVAASSDVAAVRVPFSALDLASILRTQLQRGLKVSARV